MWTLIEDNCRLPLPWILYYIVGMFKSTAKRISVESNGLVCSIGMLFMMLVILYGAVAVFGWRMSKKFGVTMIVSYGLFCMLSILLEIDYLTCPLKRQPSNIWLLVDCDTGVIVVFMYVFYLQDRLSTITINQLKAKGYLNLNIVSRIEWNICKSKLYSPPLPP